MQEIVGNVRDLILPNIVISNMHDDQEVQDQDQKAQDQEVLTTDVIEVMMYKVHKHGLIRIRLSMVHRGIIERKLLMIKNAELQIDEVKMIEELYYRHIVKIQNIGGQLEVDPRMVIGITEESGDIMRTALAVG